MKAKKEQLTLTLKNLIKATENKEIFSSEDFLKQLIDELQKNNIVTVKNRL